MSSETVSFEELGLPKFLLSSLNELGYEVPTPIQQRSIPILMQGEDLLAQAQTGTGKTAAFALPILAHLDLAIKKPQALVIAPTRELAIQVAEAFQSYAKHMKGFHVAPIYGGQDYRTQLRALKRGSHVIVGTPGRVMDHIERGSLRLDAITSVVLDEADEMLKMGFIDDIEWILEKVPSEHRTGLFSATLPASIQKIAKRYLKNAQKIQIAPAKNTVAAIEQFYACIPGNQKLDMLTRFLEVEDIQAAIIFARTKTSSAELAEKLQARGYAAAALNGDMKQSLREKVIGRIKKGELDIIVATDVAARGIDVERISHVINYDMAHDVESYIHRIGRTGRAGRTGKAVLFITPREQRLLRDIERHTKIELKKLAPPSREEMREKRNRDLTEKVVGVISKSKKLGPYRDMIKAIIEQEECEPSDIAAALAYLLQQGNPLPSDEIRSVKPDRERSRSRDRKGSFDGRKRSGSRRSNSEERSRRSSNSSEGGSRRPKRKEDSERSSTRRKPNPKKPSASKKPNRKRNPR